MKLNHAKIIVNEPKYLEALKVIAEAEAEEKAKLLEASVIPSDEVVEEPVVEEPVDPKPAE